VGGIPQDSNKREISRFFRPFGKLLNVDIPVNKKRSVIKGFSFVTFEKRESMDAALALKSPTIRGKAIAIRPALTEKEAQSESQRLQNLKLYVRGFPLDASEQEIESFFSQIAPIDRVLIAQNAKLNKFRGFAYVIMRDLRSCRKVLEQQKKLYFRGHLLSITESKSKEQLESEKRVKPAYPKTEGSGSKRSIPAPSSDTKSRKRSVFGSISSVDKVKAPRRKRSLLNPKSSCFQPVELKKKLNAQTRCEKQRDLMEREIDTLMASDDECRDKASFDLLKQAEDAETKASFNDTDSMDSDSWKSLKCLQIVSNEDHRCSLFKKSAKGYSRYTSPLVKPSQLFTLSYGLGSVFTQF
jgi:RNA recognition motif-containing protein